MELTQFAIYIAGGGIAGILAGLFGIGGGLIIVPTLTFLFSAQGYSPQHILHLALGTSLASIIFTSLSSLRAHHRRHGVIWPVVLSITPGILLGTFSGTWIAAQLSSRFLTFFFSLFLFYVATQMVLNIKPLPSRELPSLPQKTLAGIVIGIFSSLVGIGGGTLSVPYLVFRNVQIHRAIGTSAAIGLPIALAGSAGYMLNGLGLETLPSGTIGFIHLPALAGLVAASMLTAPLGAQLAHSLPVDRLKRIFALLLYIVALRMFIGAL